MVLKYSETNVDRWIERAATLPASAKVALWHDPAPVPGDGPVGRVSRLRAMRCAAIGQNGLRCKRMVAIGAPLCMVHTHRIFGLDVAASGIPGAGRGLYTMRARKAHALLCPYPGRWYLATSLHPDFAADYACDAEDGWIVDSLGLRGIGSLANTALGPPDANGARTSDPAACNARIICVHNADNSAYSVVVQATRALRRGEEIFVDYGPKAVFPAPVPGGPENTDPALGPVVKTFNIRKPKCRRALLRFT